MTRGLRIVGTLLLAFYPLAIWAGLSMGGARAVGGVLLISLLVMVVARRDTIGLRTGLGYVIIVVGLVGASIILDRERFLLATPVVINVLLLVTFGSSLLGNRVPTVERFARAIEKELSPAQVSHCRSVTKVWCVFFVINGSIALWLSIYGSLTAWALYTGGIAYGLMGLLFAVEYVVRRLRFG